MAAGAAAWSTRVAIAPCPSCRTARHAARAADKRRTETAAILGRCHKLCRDSSAVSGLEKWNY